jgi:hypothetical protein
MVILRATLILGGQKEDKGMMCNITPYKVTENKKFDIRLQSTCKRKIWVVGRMKIE